MRGSLKNWEIKGALKFMENNLFFSQACSAILRIASGQTVKKKP